jgi:hypothetical protein
MDEGRPVAYRVLEEDVPVYAAGGESVGCVIHVVAAPEVDIFHGIVMSSEHGDRFVAAERIASLHERGVNLDLAAAAVVSLPEPRADEPAWQEQQEGSPPSEWRRLMDRIANRLRGDG